MAKEQADFYAEQARVMNDDLQQKLKKFIQDRHQENAVLEYVMAQEANDSDEEFNHFDQMASKLSKEEVTARLKRDFLGKMERVQKAISSEE